MHFEISRGLRTGRTLTTVQRTSALFAEEPVVLGKVLRRGSRPFQLSEEEFGRHKPKLLRLLLAGAINITEVDDDGRRPYRRRAEPPPPEEQEAGDKAPEVELTPALGDRDEEKEADEPPSSEVDEEQNGEELS